MLSISTFSERVPTPSRPVFDASRGWEHLASGRLPGSFWPGLTTTPPAGALMGPNSNRPVTLGATDRGTGGCLPVCYVGPLITRKNWEPLAVSKCGSSWGPGPGRVHTRREPRAWLTRHQPPWALPEWPATGPGTGEMMRPTCRSPSLRAPAGFPGWDVTLTHETLSLPPPTTLTALSRSSRDTGVIWQELEEVHISICSVLKAAILHSISDRV